MPRPIVLLAFRPCVVMPVDGWSKSREMAAADLERYQVPKSLLKQLVQEHLLGAWDVSKV